MKNKISIMVCFLALFATLTTKLSANQYDVDSQFSSGIASSPSFFIGANYNLYSNGKGINDITGNGFDISVNYLLTKFFTIDLGYAYMNYSFSNSGLTAGLNDIFDNKVMLGARLYVLGFILGGGIYGDFSTMKQGKSSNTDAYMGGYLDVGYRIEILQDFLYFETGVKVYFASWFRDKKNVAIINVMPDTGKDGSPFQWNWYIGGKILI